MLLLWPLELSVSPRRSSFLCRDFLSPEPFALSCNTIKHGSYNIIHSGPLGGASTGVLTARQSVGSADQSGHSLGAVRRCCGCCRKCWQSVRSATRVVIHSEPVGGASSAVVSARHSAEFQNDGTQLVAHRERASSAWSPPNFSLNHSCASFMLADTWSQKEQQRNNNNKQTNKRSTGCPWVVAKVRTPVEFASRDKLPLPNSISIIAPSLLTCNARPQDRGSNTTTLLPSSIPHPASIPACYPPPPPPPPDTFSSTDIPGSQYISDDSKNSRNIYYVTKWYKWGVALPCLAYLVTFIVRLRKLSLRLLPGAVQFLQKPNPGYRKLTSPFRVQFAVYYSVGRKLQAIFSSDQGSPFLVSFPSLIPLLFSCKEEAKEIRHKPSLTHHPMPKRAWAP